MHTPDPATPPDPTLPAAITRRDRLGIWIAWAVILLAVGSIAAFVSRAETARSATRAQQAAGDGGGAAPAAATNPQLGFAAKYAVGANRIMAGAGQNLADQLRDAAKTSAERVAVVPPIAELLGKDAAVGELDKLPPTALRGPDGKPSAVGRDVESLRAVYAATADEPPTDADRQRLRERLGWSGRLAATFGLPDTDPKRDAVLNEADRLAKLVLAGTTTVVGAMLAGAVLLVILVVLLAQRQMRLRYSDPLEPWGVTSREAASPPPAGALPPAWSGYQLPGTGPAGPPPLGDAPAPPGWSPPPPYLTQPPSPLQVPPGHAMGYGTAPAGYSGAVLPPPARYRLGPLRAANGRTGPFLEAFAIYLAGQIGVSLLARWLLADHTLVVNFVVILPVLLAVAWPWVRGVRGADYRRGFGFVAPRGVLRELGSGVVGYVAGLPIAAVGLLISIGLVRVTGASPSHPIVQEAAGGGPWQIVLLFALAAVWAPVVEEMFFRGALFHHLRTRWGWLMSALISSVVFAAVHPQGWSLIPGLAGLAIVFSGIREWRSSTYAGMAAHALHNGALVTLLVVGMG